MGSSIEDVEMIVISANRRYLFEEDRHIDY